MKKTLNTLQLLVSVLRLPEITLMTGFLLIGFFCAVPLGAEFSLNRLIILSAAVFMHFSSIYFFNSYTGYSADEHNSRIKHGADAGITKKHFLYLSIVILLISLVLFWFLNKILSFMAIVSYMIWLVYSWKDEGLKHVPFAGTILHFLSQLLHFSMGWIAISTLNYSTMIEGIYFALLFAGGHLNHELIDYEADIKTNIKTGAVSLGKYKTEFLYRILSVFTLLYICFVFFYDQSFRYLLVFIPASVLQMLFAFSLKEDPLKRRTVYRLTFLLSGLIFIFLIL